ncbi:hypothetical protein KBD69_05245 [Candidatus Woesebacteria bacterium]|nr:hypothetical protein [Candidatus Woesebacteria bacterium]
MKNDDFVRKMTEDGVRQEFEQTFSERVVRYLEVKPHGLVPNTHFARASSECSKMYRDAHFLGCISLAMSVAESLTRFVCVVNHFKPASNFERNLRTLVKSNVILPFQEEAFLKIWSKRDDYHHLNPQVEGDYRELMRLSKEKLLLLNTLEEYFFEFGFEKGVLIPRRPQYWTTGTELYLRLD